MPIIIRIIIIIAVIAIN